MPSKYEANKKHNMRGLKAAFLLLLLFTLASASVSAVTVEVTNFRFQDSATVSERYYAVSVKVSDTASPTVIEKGIVEMGLSKDSAIPFLGIFQPKSPCEATFPWNTHAYYEVSGLLVGTDAVSFTLTGRGIPDGTYYPVITHATGCFNVGGQPKEPYGYGKRITGNAVVFGASTGNVNDQCNNPYEALQWVRAKGDVACLEAVCDNAASTSSTARCVRRAECAEGAQQWHTCVSGESIAVRSCVSGLWTATGTVCKAGSLPDTPVPTTPNTVKADLGGSGGIGQLLVFGVVGLGAVWLMIMLLRKAGLKLI